MQRLVRKALQATLVAVTVLAGCSARKTPESPLPAGWDRPPEQAAYIAQTEPVPIAQQMAGQTGIVQVTVTDTGYEPAEIATTVGGRVKIHLINRGSKEHTITIPRWGVFSRNLAPGEENYIEFTAGEKGIWPYFSDAPGEPEPGIAGHLKVE